MQRPEVKAYVALGANLGDPVSAVRGAFERLACAPGLRLLRASSLYRTAPVQARGPDFINAVAELATPLSAPDLLRALQAIETEAGRERPYRNAPRTLDLDLLLHGTLVLETAVLVLPHPRLHQRAFVLEPLAELDAELQLPGLGPLRAWRQRARCQRIERVGAA